MPKVWMLQSSSQIWKILRREGEQHPRSSPAEDHFGRIEEPAEREIYPKVPSWAN
jgi:hypothetical protein